MISTRHWTREFGADPAAIGRTLRLRGQTYTIVGVVPASFNGMLPMLAPEIWVPFVHVQEVEPAGIQDMVPSPTGTGRLDRRGTRWIFAKGRLRPGATLDQARANLEVMAAQLRDAHPQTNKDRRIAVMRASEVRVHPLADRALLPVGAGLMVAVGLVLLIACANVASMLLARATSRQREISIRLAIGASRGRLVRQLLTESVILSLAGATAGVLLAAWFTRFVSTLELPIPIPVALDLRIDGRVLLFTLVISTLAGVLAGLAPALKASSRSLSGDLRGESASADVAGRRWTLRDALVGTQIAVTVVLLVVAGLLTRSLAAAQQVDLGFETSGLAIVSADVNMLRYDEARSRQFWDRAVERARAIPGVQSVALGSRLPFSINFNYSNVFIPGRHKPGDRGEVIQSSRVSAGYFSTLGIPVVQGRGFSAADTPQSPGVVVISDTMARRYWPGESPLGKRIHTRGLDGPAFEVVGVAADHKVQTVGEAPQAVVHFALEQQPDSYNVLMARTRVDATATLAQIRRDLLDLEPNLVLLDNQTMEDQVSATLFPARAGAWVVSIVGSVAMGLAAIGLYGVIAYSVARRTREIGIRMALGARPSRVLSLVMRQGLTVAAGGLAAGFVLAAIAARLMSGALYGIGAVDPVAWTLATLVVLGVSAAANLAPAVRAARVHPSSALRSE
jgi:predicted permease